MGNVPDRKIDTAQWKGACLFVYFDFEFFPMRVRSGHGSISWQDHEWQGIGDVLRQDESSNWSILSPWSNERGRVSASLPMGKEMQEILSEEYYRGRKMYWMICSMDSNGDVERRVRVNRGRITGYRRMEDSVTFTAQCEFLESLQERDARTQEQSGRHKTSTQMGVGGRDCIQRHRLDRESG